MLKELVEYAAERGLKIWVWKHFHLLQSSDYRRRFFSDLHEIGVAGVKVDFIESESASMIDFYEQTLTDAARMQIDAQFSWFQQANG